VSVSPEPAQVWRPVLARSVPSLFSAAALATELAPAMVSAQVLATELPPASATAPSRGCISFG